MHGLGNDFVIIDQRKQDINLNQNLIQRIADRNKGVGFDQLAIILSSKEADAELVFFNSDGSESRTCGNATRCIAKHLMQEKKTNDLKLSTDGIILIAKNVGGNLTSVNMGVPKFKWNEIPLDKECDNSKIIFKINEVIISNPTFVNVGNPHAVFFVDDLNKFNIDDFGPIVENYKIFPEKCNVTIAQILSKSHIKINVWERGAGKTLACGTAACATAVAANTNNLCKIRHKLSKSNLYLDSYISERNTLYLLYTHNTDTC